jgi:PAS domain S-box-containing protein
MGADRWITQICRHFSQEIGIMPIDLPNLMEVFFRTAQHAVIITDGGGVVTHWNNGARNLYGWQEDEVVGRHISELTAENGAELSERIRDALYEAGTWTGEFLRRRKQGAPLPVIGRISAVFDDNRELIAILDTSNDITERKQAEEALRARERELRLVVDTIPTLVWSATPDLGEVDYINRRWSELGWTLDDIGGRDWRIMMHPDDLPRLEKSWSHSVVTGEPYEAVTRMRNAAGVYRWTVISAQPLRDENGRIFRWYGVANDIEDRKQAEDALLRAQSDISHMSRVTTLGELTASIAHEVNQPLAAAVTNGEAALRWLTHDPVNQDAVRMSIEQAVASGRRASEVIMRLRALAKRSDPAWQTVELNGLVADTLLLLRREIEDSGTRLSLDLDAAGPAVCGDFVQLQQVVINLAMNGIQAMGAVERSDRTLVIRTRHAPEEGELTAVLEVADSGTGLSDADANRLFDPFYTTKPNGLGMGLAICRSIVEAHRGRVKAFSGEPKGAHFVIHLPPVPQQVPA